MTYSIVARDPTSGAFGVAVQSHFFGVGPVVPWLEPGVGAIAATELVFWRGIELALGGDEAAARRELDVAFAADPTWREALRHVAEAGHVGDDPELVNRLLSPPS